MKKQSNEYMLDLLKIVQSLQIEIVNEGLSAHLDVNTVHNVIIDPGTTHISFELIVFDYDEIVEEFDFQAISTKDELDAELRRLSTYVRAIKKN